LPKKAVCLVSGGIDSTGYAAILQSRGFEIHPVVISYGQKSKQELLVAFWLSKELDFQEPKLVDFSGMINLWPGTQLTDSSVKVEEHYTPSVVVPIRNIVMLAVASAYGLSIGAEAVAYGAHTGDVAPRKDNPREPLYPDCTQAAALSFAEVLKWAHHPFGKHKMMVISPAIENLSKQQLLKKSYEVMGSLIFETWSCYEEIVAGQWNRVTQCGRCESCRNRKAAFKEAGIEDETSYIIWKEDITVG